MEVESLRLEVALLRRELADYDVFRAIRDVEFMEADTNSVPPDAAPASPDAPDAPDSPDAPNDNNDVIIRQL